MATTITNTGSSSLVLTSISAGTMGGILNGRHQAARVFRSQNSWSAEHRWSEIGLAEALPDIDVELHELQSRAVINAHSTSTWTTGDAFPVVFGEESDGAAGFALQLEVTGPWSWQLGDLSGMLWAAAFAGAATDSPIPHALAPGGSVSTPRATFAIVRRGGWQQAVASLHRSNSLRRSRSQDSRAPAVVFNDWMMTLRADPHEEQVRGLAVAAAEVGAEVYCIDAGWFDEQGDGWWETIGAWVPSPRRFPATLHSLVSEFSVRGLGAGIWVEPELVGVASEVVTSLEPHAIIHSAERPLVESGRHFLDMSEPANRRRLHGVIDDLVSRLGFTYLKLDYNNRLDAIVDSNAHVDPSAPQRMAAAFASWLSEVRERHPALLIENCASGAMRADPVLMDIADAQSTSDQHDGLRYATIAVNAPAVMPFWQASHWTVVRPELTINEVGFALVNGMAGRLCLSGLIDRASRESRDVVRQAIAIYKSYRHSLVEASPFWPMGLARWNDAWLALGQYHPEGTRIFVWKRSAEAESVAIDVSRGGAQLAADNPPSILFSSRDDWRLEVTGKQELMIGGGLGIGACIIELGRVADPRQHSQRKKGEP
jgi:alpha-galactosidase